MDTLLLLLDLSRPLVLIGLLQHALVTAAVRHLVHARASRLALATA